MFRTGYTATCLGVSSKCRLRNMQTGVGGPDRSFLEVDVVPALPLLEVTASQSGCTGDDISCYPESLDSSSPVSRALKINMYAGERCVVHDRAVTLYRVILLR